MHQQPLLAPHLPNRSSSAGHRSGVSGRIGNFAPTLFFVMSHPDAVGAGSSSACLLPCFSLAAGAVLWLNPIVGVVTLKVLGLLLGINFVFSGFTFLLPASSKPAATTAAA